MKRKRKLVLAQQMGFSPFASVKQGQGLLGQFSTADQEQAAYNQNLFNQGFRPVSLYGTHPSGLSSTTVAKPVVSQDYASNQRAREQQQQRVNEHNKIVLKKRAEMKDNKGDFSTGNFTTQEKFRFFPSSVGGPGQAIDEYLNPAYFVGSLASDLGNSFSQSRDQGSIMPTLGALGSTVLAGVAGFDPLGGAVKGYRGYASPAMDAAAHTLKNQYNALQPLYKEAYNTFKNTSDLPFGKRLENALYSGATSTKLPGDITSHSYFTMFPDEVKEAMSNEIKKLPEGSFVMDYNMSHNSAPLMYTQALKNSNKGFRVIRTGETRPLNDAAMMGDRFDKALPQSVREAIAPEMKDYRSNLSNAESRYKTAQELHAKGSISDMDLVDEKELYRDATFDLHPYNRVLGTLTPDQKLEFIQNYKSTLDNPLASINKATGINLPMSSIKETSIPHFNSQGNLVGETPYVEHRVPIMRVLKEGNQSGLRLKQMKPSLKGMFNNFKSTYDMFRNPNSGFTNPAPAIPDIPEDLYMDPDRLNTIMSGQYESIINRSPNHSDRLNTTTSNQTSTPPFEYINYENLPPRPPGGWEQVQIHRSGGRVKQNAGGGDAYDFGSSVLQNYVQTQQQRQEQASDGQSAQGDETPLFEPQEEQPVQETQQDPNMAIPGADFFAQMQYEYTGNAELRDQLNEVKEQLASMQEEQGLMAAGIFDDSDNDEDHSFGNSLESGSTSPSTDSGSVSPSAPAGSNMPKGSKGSAAIRHNNPGNIKFGDFAKGFDAEQGDMSPEGNHFAYFPTIEKGLQAQRALLKGKTYRDLTVEQAMNRWITGNPNQPGIYAKRAAAMFNNRKISELSDSELQQLQNFMIKNEDKDMAEKLHLVQSGGKVPVAQSYADKYHGLNNDTLNELLIKNSGYNHYRGLDSGEPVHLYDDLGASTVLFGPDDMATLYGNVYEHR